MKIVFAFASFLFGFGVICTETVRETGLQTQAAVISAIAPAVEEPVMTVLLDTVEVTSSVTTNALAGNLR